MPARRRVLVVESDRDNRVSLGLILESNGHEVHLAETGEEAIAIAATQRPDIVVLDLGLRDMTGECAAQAMKTASPSPFVIAYSGFHRREAPARAGGCDAFVLKPSLDLLLSMIEAFDQAADRARASR